MICPHCGKDTDKDVGGLTPTELAQANAKVSAIIEQSRPNPKKYLNREKFPEPLLWMADLYHELTQQEPTKRVLTDWLLTFTEWQEERLEASHIREAVIHASREGGFLVGRPGALTNTAVAIKSKQAVRQVRSTTEITKAKTWHDETPEGPYVPMPEEARLKLKAFLKEKTNAPSPTD